MNLHTGAEYKATRADCPNAMLQKLRNCIPCQVGRVAMGLVTYLGYNNPLATHLQLHGPQV